MMAKDGKNTVKGRVVLKKKNLIDVNDVGASVLDGFYELFGQNISFQLISATHPEDERKSGTLRGKVGNPAILEDWNSSTFTIDELTHEVNFEWNEEIGLPGAVSVKNNHHSEFFLKTITLENVPGHGEVHFICNSWVYPSKRYQKDRVFFSNKAYLPGETPEVLVPFREEELIVLRGNGSGELQEWDRVYDYAFYNDLGDPDNDIDDARPVLGGSSAYPYPRRGRTGRPSTTSDPETESRLPLLKSLDIYVPRDERFVQLKLSDFLGNGFKSILQFIVNELQALDTTYDEFDSFEDVLNTYEGGIKLPEGPLLEKIQKHLPFELLRVISQTDGEGIAKFPMPQIIDEDKSAWRTDEEFAREMLAGVNPVSIRLLEEFPPTSKLDFNVYGNQNSSIKPSHIEKNLDGLTIDEAIKANKLFILDHHDSLMPYVRLINATSTKIYATRTLLFLQKDGTLKPLVIELSLPHPQGDQLGAINTVYTPAEHGVEGSIWQLAKAYVAVNDSGVHQLISHWLNTHCVIEPFVIATNRQLSVLHPIHKLLQPHFRDTMNINAFARQILINCGGILEQTVFPGRYAMEMSSALYKDWVFPDQALPVELVKRGMAVQDSDSPHGLRLLIEDYPYAVDGLEIWFAIKTWVEDYCSFYYKSDEMVQKDTELQLWWKELREKGHGDKKDETWWPKMHTLQDLTETCSTIIWVASALHAAVNFGQYAYAGYLPNRPTLSRRFMPEPNTPEYDELKENPDGVYLKTITAQLQALIGVSLIEILSRHPSEEVYLGQRDDPKWVMDSEALYAFEKFGKKLRDIEEGIVSRNNDETMKNRAGAVKVPYTLLYPTSKEGLTGMGIPNSVSI
ncbi:hypothetical protein SSX86_005324 [Deinandra increscens subsp. villosa]|uniref:Lipoxygenase n=1 Tax=Deinandra increscens subsp. villosa TaxID=3103831 RepID=A0AAP0DTN8_9ASTR